MAIEINSDKVVCFKCGTEYSRRKGFFPVSYAMLHKGVGHLPVCKSCIDKMFSDYLSQCSDEKLAARQMCRKLDLYWSDAIFESIMKKSTSRTAMTQYIAKITASNYAGKSYDDTLIDEGALWNCRNSNIVSEESDEIGTTFGDVDIPDDVLAFWGAGYTPDMYDILMGKFDYYKSSFPQGTEIDLGTERLLRQICILEATIDRDSAAGKPVEKSVNTYNTLIGSLNLKPAQRKNEIDSSIDGTPLGVWTKRWENERPVPEPDPELRDVDGIIKYILTWFYGHLAKMLGIKNIHSKLYDEEIDKLKVSAPEYEGDDDDDMLYDIFSSGNSDPGGDRNE